jgi:hypothetical protein
MALTSPDGLEEVLALALMGRDALHRAVGLRSVADDPACLYLVLEAARHRSELRVESEFARARGAEVIGEVRVRLKEPHLPGGDPREVIPRLRERVAAVLDEPASSTRSWLVAAALYLEDR